MKSKFFLLSLALVFGAGCVAEEEVPDDHAPSVPKQAIDRAKTVELESNMNQVRQFISMFRQDNDGRNPTLAELKSMRGFPTAMMINPVDGKPLIYDQASGAVYPEGGKAPSKDSRASQINNSENGAPAPPQAALPRTQPPDPDSGAADAPAAPAIPPIPSVPSQ